MMMFVVAEVHPFPDGNGRTACLAMNCVLGAEKLSRIVVSTVYRDHCLLPLKALSERAPGANRYSLDIVMRYERPFEFIRARL